MTSSKDNCQVVKPKCLIRGDFYRTTIYLSSRDAYSVAVRKLISCGIIADRIFKAVTFPGFAQLSYKAPFPSSLIQQLDLVLKWHVNKAISK